MASPTSFVQLAKSLPEPLQRFFARWPPAALVAPGTPPTPFQEQRPNPFRFYKHPVTGRWQDPVYSQRRQAQLVKLARDHGVEELLPETTKGTEYQLAHRVEHGLRVKGTGVGQKVKGHIHERHMIAKYVNHFLVHLLRVVGPLKTNTVIQDGTEEESHARDAKTHPGLEKCKNLSIFLTSFPQTTKHS